MSLLKKIFPFINWFKDYNAKKLYADFIAGLTVSVILIPQVMAYSIIAGLPPVYGLYAALFGAAVAAMWGSSRQLSSGPVALVSFLTLTSLSVIATPGSPEYIGLAILLAILVGIIQIVMGFFKLGFLISFISHAVIVGFSTAAAIIIASTQIPNILGFSIERHSHVWQSLVEIGIKIPETHLLTLTFGLSSVVAILTIKKISPKLPAALIVMILGTLITAYFRLDLKGLQIIGDIASNIPSPALPEFSYKDAVHLLPAALIISIVGFLEAFAIAKSISKVTKQKLNVNQELIGQGAGNLTSGAFSGYPISGSFSRTAVNFSAGALTGMSSVFITIFVLITLLFLTPYLYYLPKAILAAIVIVAVLALINIKNIKYVYNLSKADGGIIAIVFFTAFLLKPDDAIFIGIILSLLMFIRQTMYPRVTELGYEKEKDRLRGMTKGNHEHTTYNGILMLRIDMSIFFANAELVVSQIEKLISKREEKEDITDIMISFSGVNYLDSTGAEILAEFAEGQKEEKRKLHFIYTKKQVRKLLTKEEHLKEVHSLHNLNQAKQIFLQNKEQ